MKFSGGKKEVNSISNDNVLSPTANVHCHCHLLKSCTNQRLKRCLKLPNSRHLVFSTWKIKAQNKCRWLFCLHLLLVIFTECKSSLFELQLQSDQNMMKLQLSVFFIWSFIIFWSECILIWAIPGIYIQFVSSRS